MLQHFDKSSITRHLNNMNRRTLLALPFFATAANAHSKKHGAVKIGHVWALPSLTGQDSQCFMPLLNTDTTTDALVAARSEACATIELRRNARYDDPAESQFELKHNKPIAMRPQAVHLRLVGLKQNIKLGDRFNLVLDFLNAGEVELEVYVETAPGE
jgi:periplasmic copper chaperone A